MGCASLILALGRLEQKDFKVKVHQSCCVRFYLKSKQKQHRKNKGKSKKKGREGGRNTWTDGWCFSVSKFSLGKPVSGAPGEACSH